MVYNDILGVLSTKLTGLNKILIICHNFEVQGTGQSSMACVLHVIVFHCVSSLLQGSMISFKMSLVPAGRSLLAQSLPQMTHISTNLASLRSSRVLFLF
jgi:hypothetical protein